MKRILKNEELITYEYYWLISKMYGNSTIQKVNYHSTRENGEEIRSFGENTWCIDSDSRALEKYEIYGPIEHPKRLTSNS